MDEWLTGLPATQPRPLKALLAAHTTVDALLQSVADRNVKMVFDTYHLGLEEGVVGRIAEMIPHLALVQLGDARRPPDREQNRCRLGSGVVPLAEIVAALKAGGYDGYYDVELLGEEIEADDYRSLLQHAKETFATLVRD